MKKFVLAMLLTAIGALAAPGAAAQGANDRDRTPCETLEAHQFDFWIMVSTVVGSSRCHGSSASQARSPTFVGSSKE